MKVRYCKVYTDEFNDTFQPGWVAEHTDADAGRRIALGVCVQVADDAKALKLSPASELMVECATPDGPDEGPLPAAKAAAAPLAVKAK